MRFETTIVRPCAIPNSCSENAAGGGTGGPANPQCADPDYRATHLGECGDDARCSDPLFAQANPTLCLNSPRLLLKPSSATAPVYGEVLYQAYLWRDGVETLLDDGVVFGVSDFSVAVIGAASGNAIGVSPGIINVTATYGGMTAIARLEVVADEDCSTTPNNFLLLFDVSKSSLGPFTGMYTTRLDAAEAFGASFVNHLNYAKDKAAVMRFDTEAEAGQPFTDDVDDLVAAIESLASTQNHTSISGALEAAGAYFMSQAVVGRKIVVLFTDGENNAGTDPVTVAESLRESGVILIIAGLRAKLNSFRILHQMASGGFFINALPSNEDSVADWLNGLKSYICGGNCAPEGNVTVGVGALNFTDFINWEVVSGDVDLIGKNEGGTAFFDLLPGNGLYVDGCGSTSSASPDLGKIRLRTAIECNAGDGFRLTVTVAGNQRKQRSPDVTRISIVNQADAEIAAQTITVNDYLQDFTAYDLDFTIPVGTVSFKAVIEQVSVASSAQGSGVFGNLWGTVEVRDTNADEQIFFDDFDDDNPQYIEPCGGNYGYDGSGYSCYDYGCLSAPIPAQLPDLTPLPNYEGEKSAKIFKGAAEAIACCPDDLTNCVTKVASATSDISQKDADKKAYAIAKAAAEAALSC